MSVEAKSALTMFADQLIDSLLLAVEDDGAPSAAHLRAVAQKFRGSAAFSALLTTCYKRLVGIAGEDLLRQKRGDPFHRLVAHPFSEAFNEDRLSRDEVLDNYFSFIHLVLGDDQATLTEQCAALCDELQEENLLSGSWDVFYDDPKAKLVYWLVLARIADSFKRFDIRRDWFITLMQHRAQAVSVAPNAFLPRPHGEEARPFGAEEFNLLFGCLYLPLKRLDEADREAFTRHLGTPPEKLFHHLFNNLAASGAHE